MAWLDFLRERCPSCCQRGLRILNYLKASGVREGIRVPMDYSFLACPKCGAKFKGATDGSLAVAPADEWHAYVEALGIEIPDP